MEKLVGDYFANVRVLTRRWSDLCNNVKRSLASLKGPTSSLKVDLLLSRYATKVKSYIADRDVLVDFQEAFKVSLLGYDLKTSIDRALAQGRVTGNILSELGAQQLASEVSSMTAASDATADVSQMNQNNDVETDDPFPPAENSQMVK